MRPRRRRVCKIVRVALEKFLSFGYGFVDALRFPVHFREAFADDGRLRIKRIGFFVGVNGLRREFGLIGGLVLLLEEMPHGVVVVGLGARGGGYGRLA